MPSLTPLHAGDTFADSAVTEISLDGVNRIYIKPIGGDINVRLDGTDPAADTSQPEDWSIVDGATQEFVLGHAADTLKVIGQTGESGTVKVYGERNVQDNQ